MFRQLFSACTRHTQETARKIALPYSGRGAGKGPIDSLIGPAKLNGLDPEAYLRLVVERIIDHPTNRIDELLPWNVAAKLVSLPLATKSTIQDGRDQTLTLILLSDFDQTAFR